MIRAERILDSLLSSDKTPSVHYIHFTSENVIYEYCRGFADIKNKINIANRSVFHACSVTKTFTALAILQLEQEGKLSIEKARQILLTRISLPGQYNSSPTFISHRRYSQSNPFALDPSCRRALILR